MNWIKVDIMLPEDQEVVLAFFDGFYDVLQYLRGDWYILSTGTTVRKDGVTHWIPLPAKPKN